MSAPSGFFRSPAAPWHALLAPLPDVASVVRKPVGSPDVLATPEGAAIAGWEQLSVNLSAPPAGLRHILVVRDATGRAISASDLVLYRRATADGRVEIAQESLGGRIEADGSFRGTAWMTAGIETDDDDEPLLASVSAAPTTDAIQRILALVAAIERLAPVQR